MAEHGDLKKCSICQQWYPATIEWFSPNGKNKLYSQCKQCRNLINRGHLVMLKFECQEGYKRCSQCQQCMLATNEFFAPDRRCTDGFQSACKACQKAWKRRFNEAHPGHEAKFAREWYYKNKEKALATRKRWYSADTGWQTLNENVNGICGGDEQTQIKLMKVARNGVRKIQNTSSNTTKLTGKKLVKIAVCTENNTEIACLNIAETM